MSQDLETKLEAPQSSPRRIAASRANGAKSVGPITPKGKAASAAAPRNFRHGMLAQSVVLASESRARFEELVEALLTEHCPITMSERTQVDNMAVARWRQMRTWSIQKNDFDREIARQSTAANIPAIAAAIAYRTLNNNGNSLSSAIRHETTFERQFNRALREFVFLKNQRDKNVPPTCLSPSTFSTWEDGDSTFDNHTADHDVIFQFEPTTKSEQCEND